MGMLGSMAKSGGHLGHASPVAPAGGTQTQTAPRGPATRGLLVAIWSLITVSLVVLVALAVWHSRLPEEARAVASVAQSVPAPAEKAIEPQSAPEPAPPAAGQQSDADVDAGRWDSVLAVVRAHDQLARTGVVVVDLSSGETVVEHRADEVFVPASTYKLFIAYSILRRVESGEISPAQVLSGYSLESCLEPMFLQSANECSVAWIDTRGAAEVAADAAGIGAPNTTVVHDARTTTPRDMATYLTQLHAGQLMTPEHTEYVLGLMKNQQYREAIPASFEPEYQVADKVGFLNPALNDVGIVSTPTGDYAVVILTEVGGFNWSFLREISDAVRIAVES